MPSTSSSQPRRRSSTQESSTAGPSLNHSRRVSQLSSPSRHSGRLSSEDIASGNRVPVQKVEDGLGNLADELAGAWDEEENWDDSALELKAVNVERDVASPVSPVAYEDFWKPGGRGVDVGILSSTGAVNVVQTEKEVKPRNTTLGSDSVSLDVPANTSTSLSEQSEPVTTTLIETRLQEVKTLSTYTELQSEVHKGEDISRVVNSLKSLGGQTGIETETTRLIAAHTALTMHLAHQSRALQLLSYTLVSPLTPPPALDLLNEIIPMIVDSIALIPRPPTSALCSLALFAETSGDVIEALNHLSDSLHMYRQITNTATRKLKSTKELVAQMQKDTSVSESGIRWIEEGKWERKLASRECASVCKDVVDNFEQVCKDYRERLVAKAEVAVT